MWALVRSETTAVYARLLRLLKDAVEEHMQKSPENAAAEKERHPSPERTTGSWSPSCFLVDNSQAEKSAIQYALLDTAGSEFAVLQYAANNFLL